MYAEDEILANNRFGTTETVSNLTIEDLQNYYSTKLSAKLSNNKVMKKWVWKAAEKQMKEIDNNYEIKMKDLARRIKMKECHGNKSSPEAIKKR